jgi:SAM-dependent methyltransferase
MNFSRRSHQAEMMDAENISFEDFQNCLHGLEIVNSCVLAYRPTLHWLTKTLRAINPRQPISILDVGSGGGGMLRKIRKRARRYGREIRLTGIDLNPWSKKAAESFTPPDASIQFETGDIFSIDPDHTADFIISSVFTHHLTDNEVVKFLQWMDRHATRGWFINDLHRHPFPFYFVRYAMRVFRAGPMIAHDGPISVARAFTAADWRSLIAEAGIPVEQVRISWFFPFRYCVAKAQRVNGTESSG